MTPAPDRHPTDAKTSRCRGIAITEGHLKMPRVPPARKSRLEARPDYREPVQIERSRSALKILPFPNGSEAWRRTRIVQRAEGER
jgi:hypothetical protein